VDNSSKLLWTITVIVTVADDHRTFDRYQIILFTKKDARITSHSRYLTVYSS